MKLKRIMVIIMLITSVLSGSFAGLFAELNSSAVTDIGPAPQMAPPVTVRDAISHAPNIEQTPQRIPVLLYHHILDRNENTLQRDNAFVVDTEAFAAQMKYLYDNGYYTITPEELHAFLFSGANLPPRSVFIQFDDGYYSNIIRAYPILKEYGFKATIFTISSTAIPPQAPFDPDALVFISEESMASTRDVFTYASHTHDLHSIVPGTGYTEFFAAFREEILYDMMRSFEIVDNKTAFAYPLGQFDQSSIDALRETGIEMAFTVRGGYVTRGSDPMRLSRFTVYRTTGLSYFQDYVRGELYKPPPPPAAPPPVSDDPPDEAEESAYTEIKVVIDDETIIFDIPSVNVGGIVFVPVRTVAERMGAQIVWDSNVQTITATKGTTVVTLMIGNPNPTINGRAFYINQPPMIVDGAAYAPIRFIAEALGGSWSGAAVPLRST